MKATTVHLGYEVGSGAPVDIPLRHMVVSGMTQEAGKTTTLEALISRAALPALAFITKRGERSFAKAARIGPYFRERADWQFVAAVLEATMREKMKFERSWIMRASKGAKTLADVQTNVRRLGAQTKSGFAADMYNVLDEYLNIVVPRIARVQFASGVVLGNGVNVVDVSDTSQFPAEVQALVMRSMLEWVYEGAHGVVTVIPEAWEFIPQGRGSPVKLAVEQLIRKGAGLGNYVWIDSQDIAGVDKMTLRACPVWLLGVQREANEIKRTLANIPAGIKKPRADAIATLGKGQFFACWGEHVVKTYVQPAWMQFGMAQQIAQGAKVPDHVWQPPQPIQEAPMPREENTADINDVYNKLDELVDLLKPLVKPTVVKDTATRPSASEFRPGPVTQAGNGAADLEQIYQYVRERLLREEGAALIRIAQTSPEIEVMRQRRTLNLDESSTKGRVAILIAEGFFSAPTIGNGAYNELKERWGFSQSSTRVYEALDELVVEGFLRRNSDKTYTSTGARVRVVES